VQFLYIFEAILSITLLPKGLLAIVAILLKIHNLYIANNLK
jgi:hypothetical protein